MLLGFTEHANRDGFERDTHTETDRWKKSFVLEVGDEIQSSSKQSR